MNPRLKALIAQYEGLQAEGSALHALESHSAEQDERYKALPGLMQKKQEAIEEERKAQDVFGKVLSEGNKFLNGDPAEFKSVAGQIKYKEDEKSYEAVSKLRSRSKYFTLVAERNGLSRTAARQMSYDFGMFVAATILPSTHALKQKAFKYCQEQGFVPQAALHSESDPDHGAALVVPEFENIMIDLKEVFGLYRQYAQYVPMGAETKSRPRRRGGLTAYHVGSDEAATASLAKWDRVQLTAKKVMVLAKYETELNEDAMADFGDTIAGEMAYACAIREDSDGFIGDGGSTYGGIEGVVSALKRIYGTGGGLGLVLGAGSSWSALTLANFQAAKGKLPLYAEVRGDVAWYCSKPFFETVMAPLALAAGGVTAAEIVAGVRRQFLGIPVRLTQTLAQTTASAQVPVFLGALELAAMFGDRRRTTIAFSEHSSFTTDDIDAKCTERYDINNHDCGDSVAAGPVVGIITA